MEALLEKEGDVENWNDERMDELSRRVDAGFENAASRKELNLRFDGMQKEVNRQFGEVDARFNRFERTVGSRFDEVAGELHHLSERFDRLSNTLAVGLFGVVAALLAGGIFG